MYKTVKNPKNKTELLEIIVRLSDGAFIPFDPSNTDYAKFKKDLANGAELQDADGTVIDGIAYLEELV
jgi:hypothetical protein